MTTPYTGVWVDPMRSSLIVMSGIWDAATKTMTMRGTMQRPDGATQPWRETTQLVDAQTQVFRTFMAGPGGAGGAGATETEVMTVTYRRAKTT
jgi:hypothetical protein